MTGQRPAHSRKSMVEPSQNTCRITGTAATTANMRMSPAVADEPLHLVLRGSGEAIELGAFAADGRQVMSGSASA